MQSTLSVPLQLQFVFQLTVAGTSHSGTVLHEIYVASLREESGCV